MKFTKRMTAAFLGTLAAMLLMMASVFAAEGVTNWEEGTVTVVGNGVAPSVTVNAAQAKALAKRAATVDAYRQLAEAVKGVNVDSETTVENMMVLSDVTKTKVNATVQGARTLKVEYLPDGMCEVTMQVSIFGVSGSLAEAVLPPNPTPTAFPAPDPAVAPAPATTEVNVNVSVGTMAPASPAVPVPTVQQSTQKPVVTGTSAAPAPAGKAVGKYTGLIVDCRGLGLRPCMSPVIKNDKGNPIYGYKNLDYQKVIANGMAEYTKDMGNAPRAGAHPLVVKAVAVDNHNSNPVITTADANRVLIENGATGILDHTNVVFVRD